MRRAVFVPILLSLLAPSPARADEPALACADDAERGEIVRDSGHLLEARELFVRCSQAACPAAVQKACVGWLLAIDERIPTIVPSVRDAAGRDVPDARVSLDGAEVANTGAAVRVDPGTHVLRARRADSKGVERTIVAREGEHGRIVQIDLPEETPRTREPLPPRAPAPAPRAWSIPPAAYVFGGLGVVGLGLFTYLGLDGANSYAHLRDTCATHCPPDDVSAVRRTFAFADVSLAVGVASLATAAVIVFMSRPSSPAVTVKPTSSGARADLRIEF